MERVPYDLTHFCCTTGDIGRLQTLAVIPTFPGDSISVNAQGIFRLSPLRRQMIVDCHLDLFAFWIPHRHIYGTDTWINFIKGGIHEDVTFPSPGYNNQFGAYEGAFTINRNFLTLPAWIPGGYIQIWNRFFRSPTFPLGKNSTDEAEYDIDDKSYEFYKIFYNNLVSSIGVEKAKVEIKRTLAKGMLCARLKRPWSTAVKEVPAATDRSVTAADSTFDIIDLKKVKANYRTEVDRDWFGVRYNDLLGKIWDTHVGIDVDQRPELLMRDTKWLSGHDVDGTADANLGQYAGKSATMVDFRLPRKFFSEHGALWLLCLPRFPPLHYGEQNALTGYENPSYLQFAGDPDLLSVQPPKALAAGDWFYGSSNTADQGYIPYGQEFRSHPTYISPKYEDLSGFPFIKPLLHGTTPPKDLGASNLVYYEDDEFGGDYGIFATEQLDQWQAQLRMDVTAHRKVPTVGKSIYSGS